MAYPGRPVVCLWLYRLVYGHGALLGVLRPHCRGSSRRTQDHRSSHHWRSRVIHIIWQPQVGHAFPLPDLLQLLIQPHVFVMGAEAASTAVGFDPLIPEKDGYRQFGVVNGAFELGALQGRADVSGELTDPLYRVRKEARNL